MVVVRSEPCLQFRDGGGERKRSDNKREGLKLKIQFYPLDFSGNYNIVSGVLFVSNEVCLYIISIVYQKGGKSFKNFLNWGPYFFSWSRIQ